VIGFHGDIGSETAFQALPPLNMRIILDTNLWISFLISSRYGQLDSLLIDGKCTLLFSQELLEEFVAVAKRPKLKKSMELKS